MNINYKILKSSKEKSNELYENIARLRWDTPIENIPRTIEWMKKNHFGENYKTNWFEVIAIHNENTIGFCFFMQHPDDSNLWYLGDLIVDNKYRHQNVATAIINQGIKIISEYKGKSIYAYIEHENIPSIRLHEKLGFINLNRIIPFDEFIFGENQTTFEYKLN